MDMSTGIIPQKRFKGYKLTIKKQDTIAMFEKDFRTSREVKGVSKATMKAYDDSFKRIYDFIGYMKGTNQREREDPVSILDGKNFTAQYRNYLQTQRNYSIYTVQSAMRHFRATMYYAMELGYVRKVTISLKEVDPPIKPTFTNYELEKLARKPNKDNFIEYRTWVMVHYLSSTANRVSSMLALNVGDIDF